MPTLPTPGADNDTWGTELNTFLSVAHQADGTLFPDAVKPTVSGTTGNLGATSTSDFANLAQTIWKSGTRNANHAHTASNPVAGSTLVFMAPTDGLGNWTLSINGTNVAVPFSTTAPAIVVARWVDASTFRIESAGVYTESDPLAVLKSIGTAKGDTVVWTGSGTPVREGVGTDGYILVADAAQTNGRKWAPRTQYQAFSRTGALTVAAGTTRFRFPDAVVIVSVAATVNTAPTGASLIVDVNKNGTTIFTTQGNRPTVAISGFASSDATPDVTAVAAGDYLTVDVDQIGSTIAGSDLCVVVKYRAAA